MAASMWRMNGVWRKMAGVLVLCALLLSNEVICQDDAAADATDAPTADPDADVTDAIAVTDVSGHAEAPEATAAPDAGSTPTTAVEEESAASSAAATAGDSPPPFTIVYFDINADNQDGGASGTTAGPTVIVDSAPAEVTDDSRILPEVECVGQDDISESNAVKVEVATADCEETKRIILENPEGWCQKTTCDLKIFQNDKTALVASDNAKWSALAEAFQSGPAKEKLGVTKIETPTSSSSPSSSSGSSVLAGILVSGLLAALAITIGYFKCQRRSDTKGVRLAEEAYPVDPENQGNTLVSVAPLSVPAETPEKPVVNGESNEAAKTPPPTNGHSAAKTADTEM